MHTEFYIVITCVLIIICYCLIIRLEGKIDILEAYNRVLWDIINNMIEENKQSLKKECDEKHG